MAHLPRQTTTEEHHLPTDEQVAPGRPLLIVSFPIHVALSIPPSGECVGQAWMSEGGYLDTQVSRQHLRFHRAGGQYQVEDVGSRNGTWVNGEQIRAKERVGLDDGDILRIGNTVLVFRTAYTGSSDAEASIGDLVGPWGLGRVRAALNRLKTRPERNILLEGETGTGKELLAKEVVRTIGRDKRYCPINIASISESVFEGHLFGWVKNAYSGSGEGGPGVFKDHHGGAVFLDEIGELPPKLQPKLLRLLENQEVLPVGATRPVQVDVVIVAATNRSLTELVDKGEFRQDLLARFTARITLPPLRDRPEDIYAIVQTLWRKRYKHQPSQVQVEAIERIVLHEWPANVRDLDRFVANLDPAIGLKLGPVSQQLGPSNAGRRLVTRSQAERVVEECGGNQSEAARRLGVDRGKLLRLLKKEKT